MHARGARGTVMGSHFDGNENERRALSAFINLLRAANSLYARESRRLMGTGLTPSQFGVLEAIYHLGPLSQTELSHKLLKTGGNMTMVVDNLEKHGQVERRRGEGDRRRITVHLTRRGRRLIERILPVHVAGVQEDFERLSHREQEQLRVLCRKLGKEEE
jgi:MarR family 2-MHQ and catechol resistance regulon transcriptional repressor